jgi:hypothetical protein
MQIVPACRNNMNKIGNNLPATGGHAGTILLATGGHSVQFECDWPPVACYFGMRVAATRVQFESVWPPVARYFCMRLEANREQFVSDWPPDAYYFFTAWQPVAYLLIKI